MKRLTGLTPTHEEANEIFDDLMHNCHGWMPRGWVPEAPNSRRDYLSSNAKVILSNMRGREFSTHDADEILKTLKYIVPEWNGGK